MLRLFITYRRDDSKSVTSRLYDRLAMVFGKTNVFKDVNAIPPGVDFREFIQSEIAKADVVLVVIGTRWEKLLQERRTDPQDFVRVEIESAFEQNKIVIPLLVEGAKAPREEMLPPSIRRLAFINTAKIDDDPDFHTDVDRLIAGLRQQNNRARTLRILAGMLAALVVVAVIALVILSQQPSPEAVASANATATIRAIPTADAASAPQVSAFGGMWLLSEPSERAVVLGNIVRPALVIGKSVAPGYLLVQAEAQYGWIRLNNFIRVSGSTDAVPEVNYTAPTPTPAPAITLTARPTATIRPTSAVALGYLINASDTFDEGLPLGWKVKGNASAVTFENGLAKMTGSTDLGTTLERTGYFAGSGTTTVFALEALDYGTTDADFALQQALQQTGQRRFGLGAPITSGDYRLYSVMGDAAAVTYTDSIPLQAGRIYELTISMENPPEGGTQFRVTLLDQQSAQVLLDDMPINMPDAWVAQVGSPISFNISAFAGITQIDRVDTLIKSR